MTLEEAVKGRRSIRKFKSGEISHEVLGEIMETARWAPSWGNTQPWEFYILTGKPLEEFRKMNHGKITGGEAFSTDVTIPETWPDQLKKRYGELGKILLTAMGIKREDTEGRNKFYGDMALLFGAPCIIIACISRDSAVEYAMLDVGLIAQTICLLAHDRGLGTCLMAGAVGYPEDLRKIASIPEDRLIILGIAMGYPDYDSPVNSFERNRADVTEFVTWVS